MFELPFRVLSVFPDLLVYSMYGIFLLRVTIGTASTFIILKRLFGKQKKVEDGSEEISKHTNSTMSMIAIQLTLISSLGLIVGLFTQVCALVVSFFMLHAAYVRYKTPHLYPLHASVYVLIALQSLTLLFLGPGAFAFDYPL